MNRATLVLSSVIFASVSMSAQAAAPWPVKVTADMPDAPATMTAWITPADAPVTSMEALQDTFGLMGIAAEEDAFGGLTHLVDGEIHAYVPTWGGAALHDIVYGGTESPIDPMSEGELWMTSDALLDDLGLFDVDGVEIVPAALGEHRVEVFDAQHRSQGAWTAHQVVSYEQLVDGYPAMGPGAEVRLVYGEDGLVTAMSHAVRELGEGVELTLDAPEVAVKRFLDRAGATGRWSLNKLATPGLTRVELTDVTLGYYAPSTMLANPVLEPVYEIRGTIYGAKGALGELLWYEPAATGRRIPELRVNTRRAF